MNSLLERPQRKNVADSEWQIDVRLMRGTTVIERSEAPLRISDTQFNGEGTHASTCKNIGRFIDDLAQKRARNEAAQKKAKKR